MTVRADYFTERIDWFEKHYNKRVTNYGDDIRELNIILNRWELTTQQEYMFSFPTYLIIPTGDRCNLKCIFCTPRGGALNRAYKTVTYSDFKKYSYLMYYAQDIQIQGFGEPLINKDYDKILKDVAENHYNAHINFNTNATLLNEEWLDLFDMCDDIHVNISLNASNRDQYKKIMGGDYFDVVCDNIQLFQKRVRHGMLLTTSFVAMEQTITDFPEYIDIVHELGVTSIILRDLLVLREGNERYSLVNHRDMTTPHLKKGLDAAKRHGICVDDSSFPTGYFIEQKDKIYKPVKEVHIIPRMVDCYDPWRNFFIAVDGAVTICCDNSPCFGNVLEDGFDTIWNSPLIRQYRKTMNTFTPPPMCRGCVQKLRTYKY